MSTTKQKRVAKLIIENQTLDKPLTGGQMLEKVSYSVGLQKQPSRILESDGVKEALNDYGFSEDNAKKVVASILNDEGRDPNARLKAADMTFKVHGTYAAEKSTTLNVNVDAQINDKDGLLDIRARFLEEVKAKLADESQWRINRKLDIGTRH